MYFSDLRPYYFGLPFFLESTFESIYFLDQYVVVVYVDDDTIINDDDDKRYGR
mgnify:CR=1 FL=1